jgi:hypothetical protein
MLQLAQGAIDTAPDAFTRELAHLEREQLRARLHYALGRDGEALG